MFPRDLKCRFQHHGSPYLKLGPFKMEEIHKDPFMVQFREFFTDGESDHFKRVAKGNLQISGLAGNRTGNVLHRTRSVVMPTFVYKDR